MKYGPDPAFAASPSSQSSLSRPSGLQSGVEEDDDFYDDNDGECANCGGEGFTYGCSWDWQCDTYDEGEGTCLCTRSCDWCQPRKPTPESEQLRAVLANALAAGTRSAETTGSVPKGCQSGGDSRNAQSGEAR